MRGNVRNVMFGAMGVILVIVGLLAMRLVFDPVDDCLDAGGRWDQAARVCEGRRSGR
jgi:hypothetical protein